MDELNLISTFFSQEPMLWAYVISGLFVGVLIGLSGVGGGAIMTPLLVFGFNIPLLIAIGTDLLFAAITKTFAICCYKKTSSIRLDILGKLAIGSVPGCLLGLWVLDVFGSSDFFALIIRIILGLSLIASALMLFKPKLSLKKNLARKSIKPILIKQRKLEPITLLAFLIGFLVTLSSIGAGALTAALILSFYPLIKANELVGTDLAHALPLAMIAGLGHLSLGNIDSGLLASLLLGSIPGVLIGVYFNSKVSSALMRRAMGFILFGLGLNFLYQ